MKMFTAKRLLFFVFLSITMLAACSNKQEANWEESEFFDVGMYKMIGTENKIGFIYNPDHLLFVENQVNKYMWHIWADKEELQGGFKVLASSEDKPDEKIEILNLKSEFDYLSPNNGATTHIPSHMMLPKSGMWKLETYINDQLFDEIYVKVWEEEA